MKRTLPAIVCLLLACSLGAPDFEKASRDVSEEVDQLLAEAADSTGPGVTLIVIHDGVVLKRAAVGLADLERGTPIGSDTAFRLASVSKQFTAMSIMLLAEQGRLAYDDPILRYLPELSRFGDAITIRHLLTHSAGLPDYYDVMVEVSGAARPRNYHALEVYSAWGEPLFAAGERYEYSNPGYELLPMIVERVSGVGFAEFLEVHIFAPLGMAGAVVFDSSGPPIHGRAYGYQSSGDGFELFDDDPLNDLVGAGGIYAGSSDLYRWDQALYTEALVSRKTLAEAFQPARRSDGETYPYGFGWRLEGHMGRRRVSHGGSWVGFRTSIGRYLDDRFSVILLSNQAEMEVEALADRIAALYLDRLPDPDDSKRSQPSAR